MITPAEYTAFVRSRVKWLPTFAEDFLHASVGLCGEAIELTYAVDRKNELEEIGDVEFYLTHAHLAVAKWGVLYEGGEVENFYPIRAGLSTFDALIYCTGDILDLAKKVWIYNKAVSDLPIAGALAHLETLLPAAYQQLRYSREQARFDNKVKLTERYPLEYSDAAAQARADKTGEGA